MTGATQALPRLTVAKTVANTAMRWVPPFLPTLERAFGASTTQLTTILGASEIAGLSTVAIGRHLDRGRERLIITIGLAAIAVASFVALVGTTFTFAIGTVLIVFGVANCTVAGHTFIASRVPYAERARSIGLFETSWAFSLLLGAPLIAVLISLFGWRAPYVMLAAAATVLSAVIARSAVLSVPPVSPVPSAPPVSSVAPHDASTPTAEPLALPSDSTATADRVGMFRSVNLAAWLTITGSAFVAMAGLSVFAISGTWLDDAFGVSTGGLGLVAMGFGAVELLSSVSSAAFADRIGKLRGTVAAIVLLVAGLGVMATADATLWVGVVGILAFLMGFEFAIVTSFSLVSEAMPEARGTTLGISNGVGTMARGTGTIVGGWLYGIHGVEGTLTLSASAAVLAAITFAWGRRVRPAIA